MESPDCLLLYVTDSMGDIARVLYEQAFAPEATTPFPVLDQQMPAFGRRTLSLGWASSDPTGQSSRTTDFLDAIDMQAGNDRGVLVHYLQFLSFPGTGSASRPARKLSERVKNVALFLEVVRRAAIVRCMTSSVELVLSDEGRDNIGEALSTLQRFSSRVLEVYHADLTLQETTVKYTTYVHQGVPHLVLYGVAPNILAHGPTGFNTRRRQDACLSLLHAMALGTAVLDESGANITRGLKLGFYQGRNVNTSEMPNWRNEVLAILSASPGMDDATFAKKHPELATDVRRYLQLSASKADIEKLGSTAATGQLQLAAQIMSLRYTRTTSDKAALAAWSAGNGSTDGAGHLPEEVQEAAARMIGRARKA
ncbi:hypothetical protein P389DRAFT_36817 [Cystobasidium minutum MCA 4210]|uniref:uncharacterized protein n=1 Tax=Cystobasidium minutum MCA 4210 TaxID=1397322 RepID=UPI0034CF3DF8|eukprot:jgi/Rhomi1/36817/CE36816_223